MTGKSQRHQESSTNILNISSSNHATPVKETFLLTRKIIFKINEELKKRAIVINSNLDSSFSDSFDRIDKYIYANKILYVRRNVPLKAKDGFDCLMVRAHDYHSETKDILLTASYYLKNIIILQALEDGNHRTAITATKLFLYENGYTTREMLLDAGDKVEKNVDAYGYKIYDDNANFWDLEDSRGHTKKVKYIA